MPAAKAVAAPTVSVTLLKDKPFKRGVRYKAADGDGAFDNAYMTFAALEALGTPDKLVFEVRPA